jgi:hypothetical protein
VAHTVGGGRRELEEDAGGEEGYGSAPCRAWETKERVGAKSFFLPHTIIGNCLMGQLLVPKSIFGSTSKIVLATVPKTTRQGL